MISVYSDGDFVFEIFGKTRYHELEGGPFKSVFTSLSTSLKLKTE